MPGDDPPLETAAVALKLPTFWPRQAEIWFAQAEAQFTVRGVTADATKYSYLVAALDENTAGRVIDILRNPPETDKYTTLKKRLVTAYELSEQEAAARILDMNGLGDGKPSELLDKMLALVPEGKEPGFLFREVFLRQLPKEIRAHLMQNEYPDLRELAKAADKHFLSTGAPINAIRRGRRQSSAKSGEDRDDEATSLCYYHAKFGSKAHTCKGPCSFRPSENASAGRQ